MEYWPFKPYIGHLCNSRSVALPHRNLGTSTAPILLLQSLCQPPLFVYRLCAGDAPEVSDPVTFLSSARLRKQTSEMSSCPVLQDVCHSSSQGRWAAAALRRAGCGGRAPQRCLWPGPASRWPLGMGCCAWYVNLPTSEGCWFHLLEHPVNAMPATAFPSMQLHKGKSICCVRFGVKLMGHWLLSFWCNQCFSATSGTLACIDWSSCTVRSLHVQLQCLQVGK